MSSLNVRRVASTEDRRLPIFGEMDEVMASIRERAYELFCERGFDAGRELDNWLDAEREICWPAAEFEDEEDEYEIKVALAGFEPKDITVTATPQEVIVKAEHESDDEGEEPESGRSWSEFRSNRVCRRFLLPEPIDVTELEVEYRHGLLEIEAPKAEAEGTGKLTIPVTSAA